MSLPNHQSRPSPAKKLPEECQSDEEVDARDMIIFRYRRPVAETPEEQFIISRQSQPRKRVKPSEQQQLCDELMDKLRVKAKVQYYLTLLPHEKREQESVSTKQQQGQCQSSKQPLQTPTGSDQPLFSQPGRQETQNVCRKQLTERVQKLMSGKHKQLRHNKLNQRRGFPNSIRVLELNTPDVVELQGWHYEVENLDDQRTVDDYYLLSRRTNRKPGKQVHLPKEIHSLIELNFVTELAHEQSEAENCSSDSNRESNSDYDYPDEQYHHGDSDSEGILDGDYYPNDEDEHELDEEELYRRYLRRCKKEHSQMQDEEEDIKYYPL